MKRMDWIKHRYYSEALERIKIYSGNIFSASLAEAQRDIEALRTENTILRSQLPSSHEREFGYLKQDK